MVPVLDPTILSSEAGIYYGHLIIKYPFARQQINILAARLKNSNQTIEARDKLCVDNVRVSQL